MQSYEKYEGIFFCPMLTMTQSTPAIIYFCVDKNDLQTHLFPHSSILYLLAIRRPRPYPMDQQQHQPITSPPEHPMLNLPPHLSDQQPGELGLDHTPAPMELPPLARCNAMVVMVVVVVALVLVGYESYWQRWNLVSVGGGLTREHGMQQSRAKLEDNSKEESELLPPPGSLLPLTASPQQLEQAIQSLTPPDQHLSALARTGKSPLLRREVNFAYALSQHPSNPLYLQAEYWYYHRKYNIGDLTPELPLCVVMVGRNLGPGYAAMLASLARQNYTNYRVVYIDDASNDGTPDLVAQYLKGNTILNNKTTLIRQQERRYALYNRHQAISQHCQPKDIVLDVDADDWLIGRQVFKLVSTLYQDPELWALYFNNIAYSPDCKCPFMNAGKSIPAEVLRDNKYRVSDVWRSTELRTFRKQLYDKIDEADFRDQDGTFFVEKSDAFMHYPIVEMCGSRHARFLDEFVYYYNTSFSPPSPVKAYSRLAVKMQRPYNPLDSLEAPAMRMQDYQPPLKYQQEMEKVRAKLNK